MSYPQLVLVCAACGRQNAEDARFCSGCGAALAAVAPRREVRKTVTVLFCDVVGSTALADSRDPEAVELLLARYFDRMKGIVQRHGGTVEKFIGDAVVAVFGVPAVHEDDAVRALRAAAEMREALPELRIEGRLGVNTGEIVTSGHGTIATGDAMNVAARLQAAAGPGEILFGAETHRLARDAVLAERLAPLELKGKADPVPAYRLLEVREAPERSHAARFVGREHELDLVQASWERACSEVRCELVTVSGEAGVGKSRLVSEALASIACRTVGGRCLPYGEGITYWPLVEVLKQLNALPSDPAASAALRSLLGDNDGGSTAEEIAWAFRKLLEEQAPLVIVLDDIQWAEEAFLDLVEAAALLTRDAPLLLLCMARPELIERRPSWPAPMRLEPLPANEAEKLLPGSFDDGLRDRIARAAGGNPLFLTEMVAMAVETEGEVTVPATLRALLAARLDQLAPEERSVLERGAVEGEIFHRGAVQALSPNGQVTPTLAGLVRKGLIRPDKAQLPGEDAFRFHHLLLRDAAYDALPKSVRADLHRRFAGWLGQHGTALVELDELLGYHLEHAARYLDELGEDNSELALAAGERLCAAGRRAYWRDDSRTAGILLERGLSLTRPHQLDLHLEMELAGALYQTDLAAGVAVADAAAERAEAFGNEADTALARAMAAQVRMNYLQASPDEVERLGREALALLEAGEDDEGLALVWGALTWVGNMRQRYEDWARSAETAMYYARRAGHPPFGVTGLAVALTFGPRPADDALTALDAVIAEHPHPAALLLRAHLLAMLDQIEEAWALALSAGERLRELGTATTGAWVADVARLAGDYEEAASQLQDACDRLEAIGNAGELSTYAPWLGRILCELGRYDEAEPLAQRGRRLGDPQDNMTQTLWREVQALVDSSRGQHAEAERLAREALDYSLQGDSPLHQGDALFCLAEVLEASGRRDEAAAALREALGNYERKRNIPLARRTRERLVAIQEPARE